MRSYLIAGMTAALVLAGSPTARSAPTPTPGPSPAPSKPASASTSPIASGTTSQTEPATAAQAQAQADATAARIRALLDDYAKYQAGAAKAAADLNASFAAGAKAESEATAARDAVRRDERDQAARLRALYIDGGVGMSLSVLAADSPTDAFWRASVAPRVGAQMVARAEVQMRQLRTVAADASARAALAAVRAQDLTTSLGRLHDQADGAKKALAQAQAELDALNSTARRLAQAEAAALAIQQAQAQAATQHVSVGTSSAMGIPVDFLNSYRASGNACTGMRWSLLAAVGQVESGHGRNNGPSSAGAIGPMQFMPATFGQYGVDGDHDGTVDAWNAADAIASAARYLCASGIDGTPDGDQKALFAYNRAQWYVDLVLSAEDAIKARFASA